MKPQISVVIPVYNGQDVLGDCLRAVETQSFDRERFEIIVIDDGSTDDTAAVAEKYNVRLVRQANAGSTEARNRGFSEARGEWVASLDADCIPSRTWLHFLYSTVSKDPACLGAAGALVGYFPTKPPARYAELTGGFDVERHINHPTYPYAPMGNVMYRTSALCAVEGSDTRYNHYPGPDLHDRLCRTYGGAFFYVPRAVVMHRHPDTWIAFWQQQERYGKGYASFLLHHHEQFPWGIKQEIGAWIHVFNLGLGAVRPGSDDQALIRRGSFIKHLAQRVGFVRRYWSHKERQKWNH